MTDTTKLISLYEEKKYLFQQFQNAVVDSFRLEPSLSEGGSSTIHSIKSRLKDPSSLEDKLKRKYLGGDDDFNEENFFSKVTDLAGVRILHLYQDQFSKIHNFIDNKVKSADWFLVEQPIAYSWDPEAQVFFEKFGLEVKLKDSYYTSIHYLIRPKASSDICCEIQVRTLFEEIWGEIDHTINYPNPTKSKNCSEQIRVLSKLVSTGTRLADSIFRAHEEDESEKLLLLKS